MENPLQYFAGRSDPRVEGRSDHLLEEILLITMAGVLSGADVGTRSRNTENQAGVAGKLSSPAQGYSVARHVQSCFSLPDPAELESCFPEWVSSIARMAAGEVVAIGENAGRLLPGINPVA